MPPEKQYTNQQIIQEIKKVKQEIEKNSENTYLSSQKFNKHSDIAINTVKKYFGSWREAKNQAGLQTKTKKIELTPEQLTEDIKKFSEETGEQKINLSKFKEYVNYGNILQKRFSNENQLPNSWQQATEKAGLESHKAEYTYEERLEKLLELKEEYDIISLPLLWAENHQVFSKLKNKRANKELHQLQKDAGTLILDREELMEEAVKLLVEKEGRGYVPVTKAKELWREEFGCDPVGGKVSFDKLVDVAEEIGYTIRKPIMGGNNYSMYIEDGTYDSEDKYLRVMRDKFHEFNSKFESERLSFEYFDFWIEKVSQGRSPRGSFSALMYIFTPFTQSKIADAMNATEVTVRNNYQESLPDVLEEFDDAEELIEDVGKGDILNTN